MTLALIYEAIHFPTHTTPQNIFSSDPHKLHRWPILESKTTNFLVWPPLYLTFWSWKTCIFLFYDLRLEKNIFEITEVMYRKTVTTFFIINASQAFNKIIKYLINISVSNNLQNSWCFKVAQIQTDVSLNTFTVKTVTSYFIFLSWQKQDLFMYKVTIRKNTTYNYHRRTQETLSEIHKWTSKTKRHQRTEMIGADLNVDMKQ